MSSVEMEPSSARLLFWKTVPVTVRSSDCHQQLSLTIRVLTGRISGRKCKMLRMWFSDGSDTHCVHALDVSEADFAGLKSQQGILVDFEEFPAKFAFLLDRCISAAADQDPPQFKACLSSTEGLSGVLFQVVEANDFKLLAHLELALQPVSTTASREYLSYRIVELIGNRKALTQQLKLAQAERNNLADELRKSKNECTDLESAYTKVSADSVRAAKVFEAEHLQKKTQELDALRFELASEFTSTCRTKDVELQATFAKLAAVEAQSRQLIQANSALHNQVDELQAQLMTLKREHSVTLDRRAQLESRNLGLEGQSVKLEELLADAAAEVASTNEKIAQQLENIRVRDVQIASSEEARESLIRSVEECGSKLEAAECKVAEASAAEDKSGQMLAKLSAELRVAREQTRHQGVVLSQLEKKVTTQAAYINKSKSTEIASEQAAQQGFEENLSLQEQVKVLQAEVVTANNTLRGNEQMIRWLNSQLNDAQTTTECAKLEDTAIDKEPVQISDPVDMVTSNTLSACQGCVPMYRSRLALALSSRRNAGQLPCVPALQTGSDNRGDLANL